MNPDLRRDLRLAYDRKAIAREAWRKPAYENTERDAFIQTLKRENRKRILEVGAAAGADSLEFEEKGFHVVACDLSFELALLCRKKGLHACLADVAKLPFPDQSFDAFYVMNCLVHLPKKEWSVALQELRRITVYGGSGYVGLYGGVDREGVEPTDSYSPPRYFAHYTDAALGALLERHFECVHFKSIPEGWVDLHFQSAVVRAPG